MHVWRYRLRLVGLAGVGGTVGAVDGGVVGAAGESAGGQRGGDAAGNERSPPPPVSVPHRDSMNVGGGLVGPKATVAAA
jgi:hypothetical protein